MAERCYIHGPTTTAGTCPTCDAMQRDARDTEITRLRARLAEAEKVIKPFADAAVRPVPLNLIPCSPSDWAAAARWMEGKADAPDELRKAKADAWDEAMNVALGVLPVPPDRLWSDYDVAEANTIEKCGAAIRTLVNPYRSKTDET